MSTRTLDDKQLDRFNTYNRPRPESMAETVHKYVDMEFTDKEFSFLDIGGGVGRLTNAILEKHSKSRGTILDNSQHLLDKNVAHDRKTKQLGSACDIGELFRGQQFDIIFIHNVLHHLVCDTYRDTLKTIAKTLAAAGGLLTPRGRLSLWDNAYSGSIVDTGPGRIIYKLTSSRLFKPVAHKFGANTAGVGVCFLSEKQWHTVLAEAKLEIIKYEMVLDKKLPSRLKRLLLHIKSSTEGHYWCSRK